VAVTGKFVGPCCACKSEMWLPDALYEAASHARGTIHFFCPYGHSQVFAKGESEADQMRRERDRLKQQLAQKDDEHRAERDRLLTQIAAEKKQTAVAKGVATKARKRGAIGMCQCCRRSFKSAEMVRHMKTMHPEFKAEEIQ
jgi:hypothetical protein